MEERRAPRSRRQSRDASRSFDKRRSRDRKRADVVVGQSTLGSEDLEKVLSLIFHLSQCNVLSTKPCQPLVSAYLDKSRLSGEPPACMSVFLVRYLRLSEGRVVCNTRLLMHSKLTYILVGRSQPWLFLDQRDSSTCMPITAPRYLGQGHCHPRLCRLYFLHADWRSRLPGSQAGAFGQWPGGFPDSGGRQAAANCLLQRPDCRAAVAATASPSAVASA